MSLEDAVSYVGIDELAQLYAAGILHLAAEYLVVVLLGVPGVVQEPIRLAQSSHRREVVSAVVDLVPILLAGQELDEVESLANVGALLVQDADARDEGRGTLLASRQRGHANAQLGVLPPDDQSPSSVADHPQPLRGEQGDDALAPAASGRHRLLLAWAGGTVVDELQVHQPLRGLDGGGLAQGAMGAISRIETPSVLPDGFHQVVAHAAKGLVASPVRVPGGQTASGRHEVVPGPVVFGVGYSAPVEDILVIEEGTIQARDGTSGEGLFWYGFAADNSEEWGSVSIVKIFGVFDINSDGKSEIVALGYNSNWTERNRIIVLKTDAVYPANPALRPWPMEKHAPYRTGNYNFVP